MKNLWKAIRQFLLPEMVSVAITSVATEESVRIGGDVLLDAGVAGGMVRETTPEFADYTLLDHEYWLQHITTLPSSGLVIRIGAKTIHGGDVKIHCDSFAMGVPVVPAGPVTFHVSAEAADLLENDELYLFVEV